MVIWQVANKEKKNTAKKERVNSFGFYALNGDKRLFYKRFVQERRCYQFLEEMRDKNIGKRIVVILDNFSAQKSSIFGISQIFDLQILT